ncbi:MAG: zinc ribbon domain-containing protein [Planctomycetota bacterium]|jgi:uncharacterized membrane protein YdbT with pleckstrin-like domain
MKITTLGQEQTRKCPFCAEVIRPEAIKCRYCGEFLNTGLAKAAQTMASTETVVKDDQEQEQHDQPDDNILYHGRPSLLALAPGIFKALIVAAGAYGLTRFEVELWLDKLFKLQLTDAQAITYGQYRVLAGIGLMVLVALVLFMKVLKLKMVNYEVSADRIEYSRGILDRRVDNLDMFRVLDIKLRRSILDCLVGVGTVDLITTDKTDPEFSFGKVRRPKQLYNVIKDASLEADNRRSVIHLE